MSELSLLGLDPDVLHGLLQDGSEDIEHAHPLPSSDGAEESTQAASSGQVDDLAGSIHESTATGSTTSLHDRPHPATRAVYELAST